MSRFEQFHLALSISSLIKLNRSLRCLRRLQYHRSCRLWSAAAAMARNVPSADDITMISGPILPGAAENVGFVEVPLAYSWPALLALSLAACGGDPERDQGTATRPRPGRDKRRRAQQAWAAKTARQGTLFGPGGLFGAKADKKDDAGTRRGGQRLSVARLPRHHQFHSAGLGRSVRRRHHHRLVHAGRDAQRAHEGPGHHPRPRAARRRRARLGVQAAANAKAGGWVDAQVDPHTNTDIENAILTRARQLRIAQGG